MGPLVRQLLLESVVAPFILASLIILSARRIENDRLIPLAQAIAIMLGLGVTYVLAFGWPPSFAGGARTKVMLSLLAGLVVGLGLEQRSPWAKPALVAGAIGLPLWVGLPALLLGKPESLLLALPIVTALSLSTLVGQNRHATPVSHHATIASQNPWLLILLTMAVGFAAIAALAKTLTFTELSLSLASVLLVMLLVGGEPLGRVATAMAAAMLLTMAAALLLYSEVSPLALIVLGIVMAADWLARLTSSAPTSETPILHLIIFCFLPAAAAILIARIDAGPFSIY